MLGGGAHEEATASLSTASVQPREPAGVAWRVVVAVVDVEGRVGVRPVVAGPSRVRAYPTVTGLHPQHRFRHALLRLNLRPRLNPKSTSKTPQSEKSCRKNSSS